MEKENGKVRGKYVKKERARLNKLHTVAYKNDPRIIAERKRVEEELRAKKQARFEKKEKAKKEKEAMFRERENRAANAEKEKMESMQKAKIEKELKIKMKEQLTEKLCELVETEVKPTNSTYDKYFVEELVRSLTLEEIQNIIERCLGAEDIPAEFNNSVQESTAEKNRAKLQLQQEEEQKKKSAKK